MGGGGKCFDKPCCTVYTGFRSTSNVSWLPNIHVFMQVRGEWMPNVVIQNTPHPKLEGRLKNTYAIKKLVPYLNGEMYFYLKLLW